MKNSLRLEQACGGEHAACSGLETEYGTWRAIEQRLGTFRVRTVSVASAKILESLFGDTTSRKQSLVTSFVGKGEKAYWKVRVR